MTVSILGRITNNDVEFLNVDADPSSGAGVAAPIGSTATFGGNTWHKIGPLDTDWDKVITINSGGNVNAGKFLSVALYDVETDSPHLNDALSQNGKKIHLGFVAQGTRNTDIDYRVPNPGDNVSAVDFVLTEGDQNINGNKTFGNSVVVEGNLTVNGTLAFLNTINTTIKDKLLTLNKGGAAGSAGGSGFEFEENGAISGFIKVGSDRASFDLKAPAGAFTLNFDLSALTANRTLIAPDTSGVAVARPVANPGVAGQLAFWLDTNSVISSASLFFDNANSRLGIGTNAPTSALHVVGAARVTALNQAMPVASDTNGNLVNRSVALASTDVSGVLPVANGGTNSSATLANKRLMVSAGGAIVEHTALTLGSVLFTNANGLPAQDNNNFFWDAANARLGIGTKTPARALDVAGSVIFKGPFALSASTKSSWEASQFDASTTDATATNIATIAVPLDKELLIEARVVGKRTGGSAGTTGDSAAYIRTARVKNVGGVVSIKNLQTDYTSEDQTIWDATILVVGANAVVQIKGAAGNSIDWSATVFTQVI